MGFFDALLGTNTSSGTDAATAAANQGIASTSSDNAKILFNTTNNAETNASNGFYGALNALQNGYGQARGDLTQQSGLAQGALANGLNGAIGTLQGSNANFQPWMTNGQNANGMFASSLGLNGAGGNAAAQSAFQASPGYQWNVDQATDGAARKAASLGMAGSGNTLDAITRLSSSLANNEYGQWQNNLNGLSGQGLTAVNAINGNNAAIANAQYGSGAASANLYNQLGSSLGALGAGLGTATGNLNSSLGNTLASLESGYGQNVVNNNWHGTDLLSNNMISNGKADDSVANANNGIFSQLIGKGLSLGTSLLGL